MSLMPTKKKLVLCILVAIIALLASSWGIHNECSKKLEFVYDNNLKMYIPLGSCPSMWSLETLKKSSLYFSLPSLVLSYIILSLVIEKPKF